VEGPPLAGGILGMQSQNAVPGARALVGHGEAIDGDRFSYGRDDRTP
jgi:hypothetical protein